MFEATVSDTKLEKAWCGLAASYGSCVGNAWTKTPILLSFTRPAEQLVAFHVPKSVCSRCPPNHSSNSSRYGVFVWHSYHQQNLSVIKSTRYLSWIFGYIQYELLKFESCVRSPQLCCAYSLYKCLMFYDQLTGFLWGVEGCIPTRFLSTLCRLPA